MVYRYTDKNEYGYYTWQIQIHKLFNIFLKEADDNSFVVEFKERKLFSSKVLFSFLSHDNIYETTEHAFDKVYDYFSEKKDFYWPLSSKLDQEERALVGIRRTHEQLGL